MTPTHQPGARPPGTDRTALGDPPRARRIRRAAAMPMHDGDPDGTAASAALAHAQAVAAGVAARAAVTAVAEEPTAPVVPAPAETRPDVVTRLRRTGATARGFRPDPGGDQPGPVTRGARPKSGPWPLVAAAAVAGAVLVSVPLAHKGEKQTTDVEGLDRVAPVATSGSGDLSSDGGSSPVPYATQQQGTRNPAQSGTATDDDLGAGGTPTPTPSPSGSRTPHAAPSGDATPKAAAHQHAAPRTSPSESRTPPVPWADALLEESDDQTPGTDDQVTSRPRHVSRAAEDSASADSAATPRTDAAPAHRSRTATDRPSAATERSVTPRATTEKQPVHRTTAAQKPTVEKPTVEKHTAEKHTVEKPKATETPEATEKPKASARPSVAAAPHQWGTRVVNATTVLGAGQSVSTDHVRLAMTSAGNLVITDTNGTVLWSAGTSGAGNRAVFQADGNFVVYGSADQTLWTAGTAGNNGAELVLQADGNVTVLTSSGTVVWASGTVH
ncbi:hypothetical protein [Streptomyces sp. GbtcB6]|uniref:hypothetical protein n=1 Tax=Streptomyces sp. GbtcB6 TaxID=2824751 RepID=UPI001C30E576|nr:hypothetical protein [Streptomyces sp. GbtcB6]